MNPTPRQTKNYTWGIRAALGDPEKHKGWQGAGGETLGPPSLAAHFVPTTLPPPVIGRGGEVSLIEGIRAATLP